MAFNNWLNIDVYLSADRLDQNNCIDYLGVKVDDHVTWNSHRLMQSVGNLSSLCLGSADYAKK